MPQTLKGLGIEVEHLSVSNAIQLFLSVSRLLIWGMRMAKAVESSDNRRVESPPPKRSKPKSEDTRNQASQAKRPEAVNPDKGQRLYISS